MRYICSTIMAVIALSTCELTHGQVVGPTTLTGAATSADTDTPLFEIYQAIFSILFSGRGSPSSNEAKAGAVSRLEIIGLDSKAAKTLASYVGDGLAQQHDFTEMKVSELCRRKDTLTSKAQVGDAFAAIYTELDRMQGNLWGSFDFLDVKNREILSSYAAKRKLEINLSPNNPRAVFEQSPETLAQLLARICAGK